MGEQALWKLVDRRFKGLQMIRDLFSPEEINYEPSGGYECFIANDPHWQECTDQMNWLNDELLNITGEKKVFEVADKRLPTFRFHGFAHLIENRLEAGLHPAKLVLALLAKVQQLGVQVLTGIEVQAYEDSDQQVSLQTKQGFTFTTKQLLLCTNAFTAGIVPGIDIIPNRGQVLVTSVINNLPFKGTFHFDQGYYYFRNLNNRLLLGGARNASFDTENTSEMMSTDVIQYRLEQFAREYILPGVDFAITDRWTGIMAMGNEKSPIVEALSQNVYCCVRMSGMGVALAPLVAKEITSFMHQRFKA